MEVGWQGFGVIPKVITSKRLGLMVLEDPPDDDNEVTEVVVGNGEPQGGGRPIEHEKPTEREENALGKADV